MSLLDRVLSRVVAWAAARPQNDKLWAYTIHDQDGSPYLTRMLTPRLFGWRLMLHRIHRADHEQEAHNHPWHFCASLILQGGYLEEWVHPRERWRRHATLTPGCVNIIRRTDFHRIIAMRPGVTWTLFLAGHKLPEGWGFLQEDGTVMHYKKFLQKRRVDEAKREQLASFLASPGPRVTIPPRVHEGDLSGGIAVSEAHWEHLRLSFEDEDKEKS